jgi:alkylation response protein AidB-like acyl-CoA dehydrogenase
VITEEQEELRASVRRFLEQRSPIREVRRLMDTTDGYEPGVWSQAAEQLGLQSIAVPEQYGGMGFGYVELAIVLEEMGRALYCAPYFATVALAANTLLASGDDEACRGYLPGIASGETIATLAFVEDDGRWDGSTVKLAASRAGDAWALNGHKAFVLDGHVASLVLVLARTRRGLSLFAVAGDVTGLTRTALPTLDETRKLARLEFQKVPARLVGEEGGADRILARTLDLAAVALAAEQVGGAQACLDMSVEYAKVRHQFGRPIGSFQALKHRMADLYVAIAAARAVVADACGDPTHANAATARLAASEALSKAAAEGIQLHGGIAITWEHDMHLYFKRAHGSAQLLGSPRELLSRLESEVLKTP